MDGVLQANSPGGKSVPREKGVCSPLHTHWPLGPPTGRQGPGPSPQGPSRKAGGCKGLGGPPPPPTDRPVRGNGEDDEIGG